AYANNEADLERGIDGQLGGWGHGAPLFVAVQGNMNSAAITPSTFYAVQQHYAGDPNVVFVRPDHFFELLRAAQRPRGHRLLDGDFNGDGKSDLLLYSSGDGSAQIGLSDGRAMDWHLASDASGFGDLLDGSHWLSTGDFNGDGKTDLAFYYA